MCTYVCVEFVCTCLSVLSLISSKCPAIVPQTDKNEICYTYI